MLDVEIIKIRDSSIIPTYGTEEAAGADLYADINTQLKIKPAETVMVPTGIKIAIPKGYAGFIYARSGLASKKGLAPANKVGVIDSDYRGEIMVALHNHTDVEQIIDKSERIAQLIIAPYLKVLFKEVNELDITERGVGGFGSTGQ